MGQSNPTERLTIHTLDARDHILLEVMQQHFNFPPERMFREIQLMRADIVRVLSAKGIEYSKLRGALVPDRIRKEIALVFDTTLINTGSYGRDVFKHIIPLLDRSSSHSILVGDYIDRPGQGDLLFEAFQESVRLVRNVNYVHPTQFYVVYINNLTEQMVRRLTQGLATYGGYVGHADMTFTSRFKILLSTMLVNLGIKHRDVVLQGHEPDRDESEDINMRGYPFEEHGYKCRSISLDLIGVMLSYKIERPVYRGFEADTVFSLNAISPVPLPLQEFDVEFSEAKLQYIRSQKAGSLEMAALMHVSSEELAAIITSKLSASYIYDLELLPEHQVAKFTLMLELGEVDNRVRLLAGLAYEPERKKLRLLTLF